MIKISLAQGLLQKGEFVFRVGQGNDLKFPMNILQEGVYLVFKGHLYHKISILTVI